MSKSITGKFETRRNAEMTVERLVQEFRIERTDIFITTQGSENSAGSEIDGSDSAGALSEETRADGAHDGAVLVSVDINDEATAADILAAFDEFDGDTSADG